MKTSSKRVMHMAHVIHKHCPGLSWRDCVSHAWLLLRFRKALNNGIVQFAYFKKDGSYRPARGTTNLAILPYDKRPKDDPSQAEKPPVYSVITYFDLDKQEWRSFDVGNFASYFRIWQLHEVCTLD